MKAMVFAAGLGTRLRPLTDSRPKALVEVGGKPLVRHIIDKLQRYGYDDIVLNIHHFADMLEEYFRGEDLKISFSDERDLLRDTGGGLLHARPLLEEAESFLLHNVDIFSNLDFSLLEDESRGEDENSICAEGERSKKDSLETGGTNSRQSIATLVVSERPSHRDLLFDEDMRLVGWENRRTGEVRSPYLKAAGITSKSTLGLGSPSVRACPELHNARPYAFAGIHKISSAIFPALENYASTHGEVFSIIDFYISLCADIPIYGLIPNGFKMLDVGKLDSLPLAESFILKCSEK